MWEPEARGQRGEWLARLGAPAAEVAAELQRAATIARQLAAAGPLRRVERTLASLGTAG